MASTISVVITTFNQAPYIAATVESVLAQTVAGREVVVIDDGSTDDTPAILSQFSDRIRIIRQRNQGVAAARNRGVSETTGDLVAFLDGDDLWHETHLESQLHAWGTFPNAGLIACDVEMFEEEQVGHRAAFRTWLFDGDEPWAACVECYDRCLIDNPIWTTSQIMIPRGILNEVGHSDPLLPVASDYDLYLRIAERRPFALINRVLTRWRYVSTSASGPQHYRHFRWQEDVLRVLKKHVARTGDRERHAALERSRATKMQRLIKEVYYRGTDNDRRWAGRFLLRLGVTHWTPRVVPQLAALFLPNVVKTGFKKVGLRFDPDPESRPATRV